MEKFGVVLLGKIDQIAQLVNSNSQYLCFVDENACTLLSYMEICVTKTVYLRSIPLGWQHLKNTIHKNPLEHKAEQGVHGSYKKNHELKCKLIEFIFKPLFLLQH